MHYIQARTGFLKMQSRHTHTTCTFLIFNYVLLFACSCWNEACELKCNLREQPQMIVNVVVDLSHWNQNINFKVAKESGILGVIHKATQGLKYVDPECINRRKLAEAEGLMWGLYHFGVGENGTDQADHFLKTVNDSSKVLLALDIEENRSGKNISPQQAEDFVKRVYELTGRLPLIYGSPYFLENFVTSTLTKCPLWIAKWSEEPKLPNSWKEWTLWQYTNGRAGPEPHSVNGIGPCDRNKFNGTVEQLKIFWLHE